MNRMTSVQKRKISKLINEESALFKEYIDKILFQSLFKWNSTFKSYINGEITETEFRKYTLVERQYFADEIYNLYEKILNENHDYKELILDTSEKIINKFKNQQN